MRHVPFSRQRTAPAVNEIGRCRMRALFLLLTAGIACQALAWGPEGHRVIGRLAYQQLDEAARASLNELLDADDPGELAEWCNWPDRYRDTPQGEWSAPLHYVNVPRGTSSYQADRDCPGGACSVEALRRYAGELGDASLPAKARRRAWGWVCHLAGDLHQPLHSGYADDRGGNLFRVTIRGRETNLHAFWDHVLIGVNYAGPEQLVADLGKMEFPEEAAAWSPETVDAWFAESRMLLEQHAYPEGEPISDAFLGSRWRLALRQLAAAGARLAALVNSVLGTAEK
jgi:hypothetical protein